MSRVSSFLECVPMGRVWEITEAFAYASLLVTRSTFRMYCARWIKSGFTRRNAEKFARCSVCYDLKNMLRTVVKKKSARDFRRDPEFLVGVDMLQTLVWNLLISHVTLDVLIPRGKQMIERVKAEIAPFYFCSEGLDSSFTFGCVCTNFDGRT